MSFFDKARQMLGGAQGQQAVALLSGLIQNHGGVGGLVDELHRGGLGDAVKSWVGTGANQPVTAAQIESALGADRVAKLAGAVGMTPEQASGHLANFLPTVIDKLTPAGKLPETGATAPAPNLANILSGFFSQGGAHA